MTLSTTTVRASALGSGSAGPFSFAFRVFAATDLNVQKTNALGVVSQLAYPTDYTVSGVGNASGGTVTLTVALASGESLSILRATPNTQPTSFRALGTFFPASHEDEFDRLTMLVQQNADGINRSARLKSSLDPSAITMELTPSAGQVLGWASSTQLTNVTLDSSAVALPGQSRTVSTLSAYLANNATFNVLDYAGGVTINTGTNDARAAIVLADTACASLGSILLPAGTYRVASNLTIASPLVLLPGAVIAPDTGVTVTINGSVSASTSAKIFGGLGSFAFGNGQVVFRPEWFGVVTNDGTRDFTALHATIMAEGTANSAAMQKLLDALPGQNSVDALQMNRHKYVVFRATHYALNPRDAGTCVMDNRRITFTPESGGHQFTSVLQIYSRAADGAGSNTKALFHIKGAPGTSPDFDNVSGEIAFCGGLRFEGTEFSTTNPVIQVGGLASGGTYTAQDAGPVTGVRIDGCAFAQVYAAARYTFTGDCQFTNNIVDGAYYGGLSTHGVQELVVSNNRFNALAFYPWQFNATGALTWNGGQAMNLPYYFRFVNNTVAGGLNFAGTTGGLDGVIQIINDATNLLTVCEIRNNRCIGLGNDQTAVFSSDTKSAVIYADYVKGLHVYGNYFEEWPGIATHWPNLVWVAGSTSDGIHIGRDNIWAVTFTTGLFLIPSGATDVDIEHEYSVSLANAAVSVLPASKYGTELRIAEITTGGAAAKFLTEHQAGTSVKMAETTASAFSATKGSAATANVYVEGAQTKIQNNLGTTRTFRLSVRYY